MSDMKCPNIKTYKCSDGFVTDNAQVAKSHEANIKSNKLICPFCQQRLLQEYNRQRDAVIYHCTHCYFQGDGILWQELIRTRKALDVAKERLKNTILDAEVLATPEYLASRAKETLAEITALEQKDE